MRLFYENWNMLDATSSVTTDEIEIAKSSVTTDDLPNDISAYDLILKNKEQKNKIACAEKLFEQLSSSEVKYGKIDNYDTLMSLVK